MNLDEMCYRIFLSLSLPISLIYPVTRTSMMIQLRLDLFLFQCVTPDKGLISSTAMKL